MLLLFTNVVGALVKRVKLVMKTFGADTNILRELSLSEAFLFRSAQPAGDFNLVYTFFVEILDENLKRSGLNDKLKLCLQILMKRHPLLRACVRQQPHSQPPRYFFCEIQPTTDSDVTPQLSTDESSDWQKVMTSLVTQPFHVDKEQPLWTVIYMPNVSPPFGTEAGCTDLVALLFRFSHTIVDGQGQSSLIYGIVFKLSF